ncbi:MAG TPA: metallophosphoesterase [Terracidiphilus sp.]|nr:metallophosphoesterase [Terracidiphilus sp.]
MAFSGSPSGSKLTRRQFAKAALIGSAGLALYAGEVERHFLDVTRTDVRIPGLHSAFDGMRIAQISDIHIDAFTEPFFLRHAVRRINQLKPDAVFLTGDFVSGVKGLHRFRAVGEFSRGSAYQCADILRDLECPLRYAVLGNHDHYVGASIVMEALKDNGITVLKNASLPIERGGARFWLAGLDDPLEGDPDPDLAIPASIRNVPHEPVILMCHAPDYADDLLTYPGGRAVSFMLSGHTHGGQVRMPFVGALTLPLLGKKYVEGWFRLQNLQLYVNRGLGAVGVPFRFDCPPELTVFTLRAEA